MTLSISARMSCVPNVADVSGLSVNKIYVWQQGIRYLWMVQLFGNTFHFNNNFVNAISHDRVKDRDCDYDKGNILISDHLLHGYFVTVNQVMKANVFSIF
jgi:hypothetical protein